MDEKQLEKMLALASSKLGLSPDQLKTAAQSGDIEGILSKVDKASADKIRSAMTNKGITQDILKQFGYK